jgi:hypothetical protein
MRRKEVRIPLFRSFLSDARGSYFAATFLSPLSGIEPAVRMMISEPAVRLLDQ